VQLKVNKDVSIIWIDLNVSVLFPFHWRFDTIYWKFGSSERKVWSNHFTENWNRTNLKCVGKVNSSYSTNDTMVSLFFVYNKLPNIQTYNICLSSSLRSPSWLGWPLRNICVTKGHQTSQICSVCRYYNPFFPRAWFNTFSLSTSKMTGADSGAGTVYHFGAPVFWIKCTSAFPPPGKNQKESQSIYGFWLPL